MPLYNTAAVAAAIRVHPKWVDNVLSHNDIAGVQSESQGVARKLSLAAVILLALTRQLTDELNIPCAGALDIAGRLLDAPDGELSLSPNFRLVLNSDLFRAHLLNELALAVEATPTPRRGRPPKR